MLKELQTETTAPWKQRFRATGIRQMQLAKGAPARGMVNSTVSGVSQLYAWHLPSGELKQLTDRPEGVFSGLLSPDGRYVYYLLDQGGNETGHYVRVPWEGGTPQDITPDMPPYSSIYRCAVSQAGNLFAFTPADAHGFPLYCLDLLPDGTCGPPRQLHRSPKLTQDATVSYDGRIAVAASTERSEARQYCVLAFDTMSGQQIGELWDGPAGSVRAVAFAPLAGDARLLAMANRSGFNRPLIWDLRTGKRTDPALTELEGEILPLDWSPDGTRILLCGINRAVQQLYIYDLATDTLTPVPHPGGTYSDPGHAEPYFGPDGEIFALWQDSTHPYQLIALQSDTGASRTILPATSVPPGRPWRSITFSSSDGQQIQGWLVLPEGEGPFPTILETHGGPHLAISDEFDPVSQSWLDHGFAYLTINYRGSTSFGRAFQEQIWGDLGHWEVEDMVAARNWLVQEGIALPDKILLTGASYGGYLTLMALSKWPDLWAGGMAMVATADYAAGYEEESDTFRGYDVAMLGGTPEEKPEQYAASSPITYAAQVKAPLLVIQGRNDTRCPAHQMELYEEKMHTLGKAIEVHWFDAGHGHLETEQFIAFQELMLRFAYRIVSGGS